MDDDVQVQQQDDRFEATRGGEPAGFLTYERADGRAVLTHTVVAPEHEGHGVAGRLAAAAVGWAEGEGLEVVPQCSYVRAWLAKRSDIEGWDRSSRGIMVR